MNTLTVRLMTVVCLSVFCSCTGSELDRPETIAAAEQAVLPSTIAAGYTPMSTSVTANGSAHLTMPIWTPPGVGQVVPTLTLEYDSNGPNGAFGLGWNLSGLSAIARCPRTVASNGRTSPIAMTLDDRFCLDGQQLMLTSGTYGADASTYATELESFSTIVASGTQGAGPATFTVTTKNGLIFTYGQNSGVAPQVTSGATTIRTWLLSQVADRVGNRVVYRYDNTSQTKPLLTGIDYPYTATGQGPFYKVAVSYELRPTTDLPTSYSAGVLVQDRYRATAINVQLANGTLIKSYNFTYDQSSVTRRSRIKTIQECSATTCLNPSKITYSLLGSAGFSTTPISGPPSISSSGWTLRQGDFNGDGKTDILWGLTVPWLSDYRTDWTVRLSSGTGYTTDVPLTGFSTYGLGVPVMIGSFSGRSLAEIVMPIADQTTGANPVLVALRYDAASNTFLGTSTGIASPKATAPGQLQALTSADVDGDGRSDMLWTITGIQGVNSTVNLMAALNTTSPGGAVTFAPMRTIYTVATYEAHPDGWNIQEADFNHDGAADLLMSTWLYPPAPNNATYVDNKWTLLLSNGAIGGVVQPMTVLTTYQARYPTPLNPVFLTDWNSDGCTDYVWGNTVYASNCTGGFVPAVTLPLAMTGATSPFFVDYDGDGRKDIVYKPADSSTLNVILSTGASYTGPTASSIVKPDCDSWKAFFVDMDGDGLTDLASYCWKSGVASPLPVVYPHNPGNLDTVKSVTVNGNQGYSFTYSALPKTTQFTPSTGSAFPIQDISPPIYVVTALAAPDGVGGSYSTAIRYSGARFNAQGRGFLGFESKQMDDPRNNVRTTEYFRQDYPHIGKTKRKLQQWTGSPTSTLSDSTMEYGIEFKGASPEVRAFSFQQVEENTAYEFGDLKHGLAISRKRTDSVYGDGYGNPTQIKVTTTDLDTSFPPSPFANQSWVSITDSTFSNTPATRCLGLPVTVTLTETAPSKPTLVRKRTSTPDTTRCRIASFIDEPDSAMFSTTTTLGYDACGNQNSSSIVGRTAAGTAMLARTKTRGFGTRCQLPESDTDELNQTRSTTYNYTFGLKETLTDENGLVTRWQYDDHGRAKQETRPDGTYTLTRYDTTTCPRWGQYAVWGTFTDVYGSDGIRASSTGLCLDMMFRKRVAGSIHPFQSVYSYDESLSYDALGRLTLKQRPFTPPETRALESGYETYAYDPLNRLTSKTLFNTSGPLAVGATTSTRFLGRTTQITDPRNAITNTVSDVKNLDRAVTDPAPGGTTFFTYDAAGRLATIQDAIGAISSIEYNTLGFKIANNDSDRGRTTFDVNTFGEVTGSRDIKGQVSAFDYDPLGRLITRSEPEGTTIWTWGSSVAEHNRGRIKSITSPGYSESRLYDGLARLGDKIITTNQAYAFKYGYDVQGNLSLLTYPATTSPVSMPSVVVRNSYTEGQLVQIDDVTSTTRTLWKATAFNAANSVTAQLVGSTVPVTVLRTFESHTDRPTSIQAGVSGSTNNRVNLVYSWDPNGNLQQRQDLLRGITEVLTNDPLNRVKTSTLNGAANLSFDYDQSGNITNRSNIGAYAYADPSHPHAVTTAGWQSTYTYDAKGNVATKNGATQSWTSYDLPTVLSGYGQTSTFTYGPDRKLVKQVATTTVGTETTHSIDGLLERTYPAGLPEQWRYLVPTPGGTSLILTRSGGATTTTGIVEDHLGSTTTVIADATGATTLNTTFSVFGDRTAATGWAGTPSNADWGAINATTRMGFTGHTGLDNIGLVHMKGRIYDPSAGRFMSVDPVRGATPQALNPYSYVSNRPLSLVDPSGQIEEDPWAPSTTTPSWSTGYLPGFGGTYYSYGPSLTGSLGQIFSNSTLMGGLSSFTSLTNSAYSYFTNSSSASLWSGLSTSYLTGQERLTISERPSDAMGGRSWSTAALSCPNPAMQPVTPTFGSPGREMKAWDGKQGPTPSQAFEGRFATAIASSYVDLAVSTTGVGMFTGGVRTASAKNITEAMIDTANVSMRSGRSAGDDLIALLRSTGVKTEEGFIIRDASAWRSHFYEPFSGRYYSNTWTLWKYDATANKFYPVAMPR